MNIDKSDDVVIVFSSPEYNIIRYIVHELEKARRDGSISDINDFLNDIKRHYMNVGIGSNPFSIVDAAHDSIRNGLSDNVYGYTITYCRNIWIISAGYDNGKITYVSDNAETIELKPDVEIYIAYKLNGSYNRVPISSTKYRITVD